MLHHEKYIIVEITDNSKGISQKVRMPYSCTWTKEFMLNKMFERISSYEFWYKYYCHTERPNLLPADKYWETMTNNFKDILISIENTTLEAVESECDNLPTKDMLIKDVKDAYRCFQNRIFIEQIMEMYPKEYEHYKKLTSEKLDDTCLFIERVFDDFKKKYQCLEKYVVSINNKKEEITFSNILNEGEDKKIEYILDDDSIKGCFIEACNFSKPNVEDLSTDEYWNKFHEAYVKAYENLKHISVSIRGDLKHTFTYDELLKAFNKYCYEIKKDTFEDQAEFLLEDVLIDYYKRYVKLYDELTETILDGDSIEEIFFKIWNKENDDTPERLSKLTKELMDKYLGSEDSL